MQFAARKTGVLRRDAMTDDASLARVRLLNWRQEPGDSGRLQRRNPRKL
jgi:hypothetical protein